MKVFVLCLVAFLVALSLVGQVHATLTFSVFDDQACTVLTSAVDWGSNLSPQEYTYDIYVRNDGSEAIAGFTVAMAAVAPPNATDYLTLTLDIAPDQAGKLPLEPQQVIKLTLILMIAPDAPNGSFSFNIVLTGLEGSASGGSSSGSSGGGGYYSQTLPMASKAPGSSGSGSLNVNGLFLFVVVAAAAYLIVAGGKKRR